MQQALVNSAYKDEGHFMLLLQSVALHHHFYSESSESPNQQSL